MILYFPKKVIFEQLLYLVGKHCEKEYRCNKKFKKVQKLKSCIFQNTS